MPPCYGKNNKLNGIKRKGEKISVFFDRKRILMYCKENT